jgi:ABC-type transporter Mla subunit MlaD
MDGINMCAAPLDIDPRQRYFTTVQPFSYRDTLTVLGYVQEVADHLDELRESVDDLAKDENADVDAINKTLAQIATWQASVNATLDDLEKQVGQYEDSALTYNPTRGKYEDSKDTNRDIYRELAVFGARVDQMATMTTAQAAQHDCITWAVLGNKDIFGDPDPRVTPRPQNQRPTPPPTSPDEVCSIREEEK